MFVTLTVQERQLGFWGRLLGKGRHPALQLDTADCLGARYAVLQAESYGQPDWTQIERICGTYANRVLLPQGFCPPPDSRLRTPTFPRFTRRLLLLAACALTTHSGLPLYRRVLGLIDSDAAYTDMLFPLLHHCTAVKVLTQATAGYTQAAERMMHALGAPVLLAEEAAALTDCFLLLAPGGIPPQDIPALAQLPCPVLAAASRPGMDCLVPHGVRPIAAIHSRCPPGIAPQDFTAALYEFSGLAPTAFVPDKLLTNHQLLDIPTAARRLW